MNLRRDFCICLLAALCGCQPATAPVVLAPRPVRAMSIDDAPALLRRSFSGTTAAVNAVDLSFRVGGPLVAFPANQLGQLVSRGDLLAQIDARDFEVRLRDTRAALSQAKSQLDSLRMARPEDIEKLKADVARAKAAAEYAQAEFRRNQTLVESRVVSRSEFELSQSRAKLAEAELVQAKESLQIGEQGARPEDIRAKEAQIESLQAAVEGAEDELTDTQLLAPFDGSISAAYVENFEVVQPNQRIVRLVNSSELEIRVDIPENLIALVPRVTEAFVTIQAFPEQEIPASVSEIGTEPSPITRTYPVKLRFTPPPGLDVRPGMTGTVRGRDESRAVDQNGGHVVPATAVFSRDGTQLVWLYDPQTKQVRSHGVQVLGTTPYGLSIKGVTVGQWVVTAGVHFLEENQLVQLLTP